MPLAESNNEELNNLRKETVKIFKDISDNYINTEITDTIYLGGEILNDENNIEEFVDAQTKEEINSEVRLSRFEAIQLLKKLREEISLAHPEIYSYRNILRDSILEEYIEHRITDEEKLKSKLSKPQYLKTDPIQFKYFDKIKEIISRL